VSFFRLLGIMQKLSTKVSRTESFARLAAKYGNRSLLLVIADEKGKNFAYFKVGPEGIEINPENRRATLTVSGSIDVYIDILEGRYTAAKAIARQWLDVDDFRHFVIVHRYFEEMVNLLWR